MIIASAPTSYQLQSLRAFGIPYKANGNGSYTATRHFDTENEAKEYLINRAGLYNTEDPEGSESRLASMLADIDRGVLTLDAATARIEEIIDEA